jgi:hypothetical protein
MTEPGGMQLNEATLEAIAERVAEKLALRAHPPAEVTVEQACCITNHATPSTFYRWCKRKHVRPLSRGRYSRRRLEAALTA